MQPNKSRGGRRREDSVDRILVQYHLPIIYQKHPYAVVYGQPPPPIISYGDSGTTLNDSMEYQLQFLDEMLVTLEGHLQHDQEQMKKFVDVHCRDVVFDIGIRYT